MDKLQPKPLPTDYSFEGLFAPNKEYKYFENSKFCPFRYDISKFQLVNAWWLAEASMLVYVTDRDFVKASLANAGLADVKFFDKDDTQCFVVSNNDFIIVCFRGTEPKKKDFITDIKFNLTDSGQGGKVHEGFKEALDTVWQEISDHLRKLQEGSKKTVWFTGHSLGAALATLAADRYGVVQGTYTYGSPRVGDNDFAADYFINTYRFVNNNDIVPMVPPPVLYNHVGSLKYIDSKGHILDNPKEWVKIKARFQGHFSHLVNVLGSWRSGIFDAIPNDNLNDHAPIYYCVTIWNNYIRDNSLTVRHGERRTANGEQNSVVVLYLQKKRLLKGVATMVVNGNKNNRLSSKSISL